MVAFAGRPLMVNVISAPGTPQPGCCASDAIDMMKNGLGLGGSALTKIDWPLPHCWPLMNPRISPSAVSPRASTQTLPPTSIASASDDGVGKTARGGVLVGCGAYGVDVGSVVADGTGVSDGATVAACVGSRVAVAVGGTGVGCGSSEPQMAAAPTIARPAVVSKNAAGRCRWCLAIADDSPNSDHPNDPTIRLDTRDGKRRAQGYESLSRG